jgi:hypothetical protein
MEASSIAFSTNRGEDCFFIAASSIRPDTPDYFDKVKSFCCAGKDLA